MNFPKYPAYKDSGVEWLGEVPAHWNVLPLKRLAEQVTDKADGSDFQVGLENIDGWTGHFIQTDTEFSGVGISFLRGDILFGKLRPYLAKVWLADKCGQAVGDFFVLRPQTIDGEFLHKYILTPTVIDDLNASTIGAKMPRVSWEDMSALAVALPTREEQTQIARFLDYETARIDALIEEQQRLIELLKEKRQAVISHAVTKGLDPTVPMKDSGVEWLGEVPMHWTLTKFSRHFAVRMGETIPETELSNEGWLPVYSATEQDKFYGYVNERDILVDKGDLVIPARGNSIGFVKLVSAPSTATQTTIIANVLDGGLTHPSYAYYWCLGLRQVLFYFDRTAIPQITTEYVSRNPLLLPTFPEQTEIARFLDHETAGIDALIEEHQRLIELLKEKRQTLISAAVTGKIDVRGWQPPETANIPSEKAQQTCTEVA